MRTYSLFISILGVLLCTCQSPNHEDVDLEIQTLELEEAIELDLDEIKERGYLTAIIDNSTTGMFLYRGEPMGYEYELISLFAESIGVELRLNITKNIAESFQKLNSGEGDIIARNLTVTSGRKRHIAFSEPHHQVRQMLVQRKPDNWRDMKLHEIEAQLIRNPADLKEKKIIVRSNSSYISRLKNLSDEIGGTILVEQEDEETETDAIIEMVADGSIDYTVADEDIAQINARYHSILDVETAISFPQDIAWGVRKNAPKLLKTVNEWIMGMKKTNDYYAIYDKYFRNYNVSKKIIHSEYFSLDGEKISPYDSLIKKYAKKINWDWRLLAAQISKESRFDPMAKSWVGARGLMQVMPRTAGSYHVTNLYNPKQNLKVGTDHILWLEKKWQHLPDSEKVKFTLGSYNVGDGHVRDAVKLAKKYGADTSVWDDNVAKYLVLKSKRKYYEDPVVAFGYCRGTEPVEYVSDILYRFDRYLQMMPLDSTISLSINE
ncbi:transporter substrate-binding domain-containing protein [Reichenbachiella agarivorans]|uniref:Transporter substrate-binding domain-containing protein n=1 Tax=Reichenbachiella agarivorans TaxID=2979464 RepID=A0ABY6CUH0_9BACT|nr:transporter substrate-binding domain-containing protein [Reichenbachiella agarivorans]UXP33539.1 transporter substrate-binding domain-containing protein [Reichenbachiella agarivorans]